MEDAVHEADARRLVRVLVGELDMDFPDAILERGLTEHLRKLSYYLTTLIRVSWEKLTFGRSLKTHVELLPKYNL